MRNKTIILISILVAALLLTGCTPASVQSSGTAVPPVRNLSVNGTGKAYLNPDIAYISIGVHTEGEDAADTVADNNQQSVKVSEALAAAGIDPADIRTTNFSIYPQQQYDENNQVVGVRYVVDNTVYVTLRDISKVGDILNKVVAAGANSINGIQFDVADRSAGLSEAREMAVQEAKAQAEELAKVAGVELGAIQNISSYSSTPVPYFEGKGGGGGAMMAVEAPIAPGQLVISVDVNVVYEIK